MSVKAYSDSHGQYTRTFTHQLLSSAVLLYVIGKLDRHLVDAVAAWDERTGRDGARLKLETLRVVAPCLFGRREAQRKSVTETDVSVGNHKSKHLSFVRAGIIDSAFLLSALRVQTSSQNQFIHNHSIT